MIVAERVACMDDAEWEGWTTANRALKCDRAPSPCHDCVTDFALRMRAVGRCDGHPSGCEDDLDTVPAKASSGHKVPIAVLSALGAKARAERSRRKAALAVSLHAGGMDYRDVAVAIGTHPSTISKYLKAAR